MPTTPPPLVTIGPAGPWRAVYYSLGPSLRLPPPAARLVRELLAAAAVDGLWRAGRSSGYALATPGDAALLARQVTDLIEELAAPLTLPPRRASA